MRIERVIDACARAEGEANARTTFADHGLRLGNLRWRAVVFFAEMVDDVLAVWPHLGIQLKGMHDYLSIICLPKARQRELERVQAYSTPWTRDVGYEIDSKRFCHCFS